MIVLNGEFFDSSLVIGQRHLNILSGSKSSRHTPTSGCSCTNDATSLDVGHSTRAGGHTRRLCARPSSLVCANGHRAFELVVDFGRLQQLRAPI